jgi:hypothetical protein
VVAPLMAVVLPPLSFTSGGPWKQLARAPMDAPEPALPPQLPTASSGQQVVTRQ